MEPVPGAVIVGGVPRGFYTSLFRHLDPPGSVSCLMDEGNPGATLAPLQERDGLLRFAVQWNQTLGCRARWAESSLLPTL